MANRLSLRTRSRAAFGGAAALLGVASVAQAGPVESLVSVTQHPSNAQVLVLQYEDGLGGLIFSRDGGATFQLHPSTAFTDYGSRGYVPALMLGDGKLLLGLTDGLMVDNGSGCAIKPDAMMRGWVTDLARDPADANVSYILTSGNRSDGSRTGLWRRTADGTISPLSDNDTGTDMGMPSYGKALFFTKSLRVVARSGGAMPRFVEVGSKNTYESATMVTRTPTFRYSDDLGASWTEHTVTGAATGDEVVLLAVTADNPMKVVLAVPKTGAAEPADLVLLSSDNGATFAPYIEGVRRVGQALVTPEGRFYLADMGSNNSCDVAGVWSAATVGAAPERIVDYPVRCLGFDSARSALFMCKAYEFGLFYPNDRAYCRLMELNDTAGFVACSGADDLSMLPKVDAQLCGAWCGPAHLSSSGVCDETSCVAASRAYDTDAGWIEPPGLMAPSCSGFQPADAGSPRGFPGCDDADAGADAGQGGGADGGGANGGADGGTPADGGGTAQEGGSPSNDAGMSASDSGSGGSRDASAAADSGAGDSGGAPEDDGTDDGCDCSVRAGQHKLPDLAGFGLAVWLLAQRLRARRRRTDA
jgi:hypothetical protein